MSAAIQPILPPERIAQAILVLRGHKVILSSALALLYRVEARALVQAVKRNPGRFPPDFMFQLTREEVANLKSQIVISSWGGSRRAAPYAFTEQGVAMLSSVLRSERAVAANAIRQLMDSPAKPRKAPVGFHTEAAPRPKPKRGRRR